MAKVVTYKLVFWLCWLVMCCACSDAFGQATYRLIIKPVDKDSSAAGVDGIKTNFTSQQQALEYARQLASLLQARGYIGSSVDSVAIAETFATVYVFFGEKYSLANLTVSSADKPYVEQARFTRTMLTNLPFQQYRVLQQKLLSQFEATGFPFARVKLDSIEIQGKNITASLNIDRGIYYRIDSIRMRGSAKISENFIHHYLDIEKGSPYNVQKLEQIDQRLLEVPYLQQSQPWDITMLNTGSLLNLYLEPKKSNQVNVLAGFLPDNSQLGGGKLLFTIDANLQLKNAFGSGESVGVVWQQIQPRSPRLNLLYQQPYLFKSPFGLDFSFDLFKKDSLFLNLDARLGVQYVISTRQSARLSLQSQRTNVLQVDTLYVRSAKRLPDVADVSAVNLLVNYELNNTNYRFNPSTGNELNLLVSVGNKKIGKNATIVQLKDPGFDYSKLYDSVKLNTYQLRLKLSAAHYFKVSRQSVLKAMVTSGLYVSPNSFRNELFQIGGYKLLRGFDEESIYSNRFTVATAEFRYLLGLNSYFFGFTDVGVSGFKVAAQNSSNSYVGAGVGIAFETKGGIFNLSYAVGKQNDIPFNIKQSKIHFGYVSIF